MAGRQNCLREFLSDDVQSKHYLTHFPRHVFHEAKKYTKEFITKLDLLKNRNFSP